VISRPAEDKGVYRNLEDVRGRNNSLKIPYSPLISDFKFGYPPVDELDPAKITYEMLIELMNKTDWNLRQLVGSLEAKLNREHKFYQVEKARMRFKAWGNR
jgi:hypothetical protein